MARTTRARTPDLEERAHSLGLWAQTHIRQIAIASILVVAVGVGVYLWRQTREAREQNAMRSMAEAAGAMQQGNIPLATRNLEQLVQRFDGTRAAHEGRLILAQLLFDQGRYQEGISRIEPLEKSKEAYTAATAMNLAGAGYEQLGQFDKAAAEYQKAADEARFPNDRATYLANAARAYTSAGNLAEARKIWARLADDPDAPPGTAGEARVRLGELEAKPQSRG
jgi:tetratricopeptide (TPR) repeat protein